MAYKFTSQLQNKSCFISRSLAAAVLLIPTVWNSSAADNSVSASGLTTWQKPAWLTDLSLGVKESYDDNVLLVSGNGMAPQSSWVSTVSPKVGLNFAPLLGNHCLLKTVSLVYAPEFDIYHNAPSETYNAQRINDVFKGGKSDFSFNLDNAFLYNDGNREAATYALNQTSNQNDKYRNFYAQAVPRERRNQIQDRSNFSLQYDSCDFFFRPVATLLYYDLNTYWHNTGAAPYKGYQNYPDRYDVNGGADFGYRLAPNLAVTLGYRYGHQYQQQFTPNINADLHESSSDYQRALVGLEGKPWNWLEVKVDGGPDFRDYNPDAPVNNRHLTTYYGEAVVTAAISTRQSVSFNYKQWQWVSSTGLVPYFDSTYVLNYHWSATHQLGLDLGGKILEADYTSGNDVAGSAAPSLRDDRQYTLSAGATFAFTPHLSANLAYAYDLGENVLKNLPASLQPYYRDFNHQLVSLGLQYKF